MNTGAYDGEVVNLTYDTPARITATMWQDDCILLGELEVFPPLGGSGPIVGSIVGDKVEFKVRSNLNGLFVELIFTGEIASNGYMSGTYQVPPWARVQSTQLGNWFLSPAPTMRTTPTPILTATGETFIEIVNHEQGIDVITAELSVDGTWVTFPAYLSIALARDGTSRVGVYVTSPVQEYGGYRITLVLGDGTQKEYTVVRTWSLYVGATASLPESINLKAP